jgi:hypothetical protein
VIDMRNAFLIAICACGLGIAADPPYAGDWKMNAGKSDFGEATMTFEQLPGGEMKTTMDGQSYSFKTDGKDNMTPWGMTMAWKPADSSSWQITEKTNGKVSATGTVKLAADGKTLIMDTKRVKADGGTTDDSMTLQRVSGGPGLAGKWKTRNLKSSSPETLKLVPKGDGLKIMIGNEGGVCDAKFDGKAYPATGPLWPAGWTCVVARNGTRGLDMTWKKDGKDMYKSSMVVSDDGATLTESTSAPGTNEKIKIVYDRERLLMDPPMKPPRPLPLPPEFRK